MSLTLPSATSIYKKSPLLLKADSFFDKKGAADFSLKDPTSLQKRVEKVVRILLIVSIPPLTIYFGLRFLVGRLIMMALYPAQNSLLKKMISPFKVAELDQARQESAQNLRNDGYLVRHISFQRNGTTYSGILVGHKRTIDNGKWALQATGNACPTEWVFEETARKYRSIGYNLLMVNGPGVGRSSGIATPKTMGEAQETALRFLESNVEVKHILLAGHSIGGAAMGQAILQHSFQKDITYTVLSQLTFDKASAIAEKIVAKATQSVRLGKIASLLIRWTRLELDTTKASKLLAEKGIKEIIIQSTHKEVEMPTLLDFKEDGVIPWDTSLGHALIKENVVKDKTFCCSSSITHVDLSTAIQLAKNYLT